MTPLIAAVANTSTSVGEVFTKYLGYQAVGMMVVLIALTVLYGVCAFVGTFFAKQRERQKEIAAAAAAVATTAIPAPVAPSAPQPTAPAEVEATDPRVVAAIAAAISVVLARPYRIIEIQTAGHSTGMTSPWAIEGRFQHFSSHKVR